MREGKKVLLFSSATVSKIINPIKKIIPLEKKIGKPPKLKPKKIILIAGPTACGKTTLSLILAKMLKGEIVSADSMQVYRGMDIGTAKVSEEDRARVPHHLIDIRDIHESFSVVDFYYEAKQCCDSILARDRVPIVVGGSGFYFRALLYGPPRGPAPMPELRFSLEEELEKKGSQALYDMLSQQDPVYAKTITPNDKHKIIRALEIISLSGDTVTSHKWEKKVPLPDYQYHPWFIHRSRQQLYAAIDARCEHMLEAGFIEEVKELEKKGLRQNPSASQAIGYRQCLDFLQTDQSAEEYEKFVEEFKSASRKYAKRQFTWFKKEPIFRWQNVDIDIETAAEIIAQDFMSQI